MSAKRVNWVATALAAAITGAVLCLGMALVAREGHVFAALLGAAIGVAGSTAYAALALRKAEARIAKLSEELTGQSRRLLRLENRAEAHAAEATQALFGHVDQLKSATGALADALDGQDTRLRALEEHATEQHSAEDAAAVEAPALAPPRTEVAPPPPSVTEFSRLASREDFARAASAILGRLSPDALAVVQSPDDDAIVEDLEAGRLELWLEPVVTLPQRRLRYYAASPQLRNAKGEVLDAGLVREVLSRRRRIERLDAFAFTQALLVAGHLAERGRETSVCVRLSREAIGSTAFVEGAASRLAAGPTAASRLLIEIDHTEADRLSAQETAHLGRLQALGTGLALGAVPSLDQDWTALARRGYRHAEIAAGTIMAPRPHATTAFLVAEAARAGIALAASGVAQEPDVPDLLDYDVPLARGAALAPPRPVRADVLEAKAEAPPAAAPTEPAETDGRTSFRDFLRRAG